MSEDRLLPKEVEENIRRIIKRGNTVEIKKERDNTVVVEIRRQVLSKIEY